MIITNQENCGGVYKMWFIATLVSFLTDIKFRGVLLYLTIFSCRWKNGSNNTLNLVSKTKLSVLTHLKC